MCFCKLIENDASVLAWGKTSEVHSFLLGEHLLLGTVQSTLRQTKIHCSLGINALHSDHRSLDSQRVRFGPKHLCWFPKQFLNSSHTWQGETPLVSGRQFQTQLSSSIQCPSRRKNSSPVLIFKTAEIILLGHSWGNSCVRGVLLLPEWLWKTLDFLLGLLNHLLWL